MEYKKYESTIVVRLDKGEEIVESLKDILKKERVNLGIIWGIGATDNACLSMLDLRQKVYTENSFMEPMEITSLNGNATTMNGEPYLHIHANLSNSEGKAYGGHLDKAYISATGEIFILCINGQLEREKDQEIGINTLKF